MNKKEISIIKAIEYMIAVNNEVIDYIKTSKKELTQQDINDVINDFIHAM